MNKMHLEGGQEADVEEFFEERSVSTTAAALMNRTVAPLSYLTANHFRAQQPPLWRCLILYGPRGLHTRIACLQSRCTHRYHGHIRKGNAPARVVHDLLLTSLAILHAPKPTA
jgi:hypothetical protein